ncbi:hypothetical protein ACHAWF_006692, partial [Thalassiosira exigua]
SQESRRRRSLWPRRRGGEEHRPGGDQLRDAVRPGASDELRPGGELLFERGGLGPRRGGREGQARAGGAVPGSARRSERVRQGRSCGGCGELERRGGGAWPRRGGECRGRDGQPPPGAAVRAGRAMLREQGLLRERAVHGRVRDSVLRLRRVVPRERQGREESSQVENILCSNPAVVKVLEDQGRHGLETGDCVALSKVRGLVGLLADGDAKHKVKVTGPYTFELTGVDASGCSEPATQGYITQVKTPVALSFKSYREALESPGELMMSDFAKFDHPPLHHLAYRALAAYTEAHHMEYPTPGDMATAKEVRAGAHGILAVRQHGGSIRVGGSEEAAGPELLPRRGGRDRLPDAQELGPHGRGVQSERRGHVTDMDRIKKSNLSRQFLVRNGDINEFKSSTAARAATEMNPNMHATPYQEKEGSDTEHVFGDDVYDKLDGVCIRRPAVPLLPPPPPRTWHAGDEGNHLGTVRPGGRGAVAGPHRAYT